MVSTNVSTPTTPTIGRGRWAIPTRLTKNKMIKHKLQKLGKNLETEILKLRLRTSYRNPQTLLRTFKLDVIKSIRDCKKKTQPMIQMKITKLTEKLKET